MKAWSNSDTPCSRGHVPEKKLLVAVMQRAVTDFMTCDGDLKAEAECWLFDNNDGNDDDKPLTFAYICEALDFDVDSLRRAIRLHAESETGGLFAEAV